MDLLFDGLAARGLRRYADLVTAALGLVGTGLDVDLDTPVTVYLPVDRRLPAYPDQDAALLWHEEFGWSAAIDTPRGEQTIALLGQTLLPAPDVVARLAMLVFDGHPVDVARTAPLRRHADIDEVPDQLASYASPSVSTADLAS